MGLENTHKRYINVFGKGDEIKKLTYMEITVELHSASSGVSGIFARAAPWRGGADKELVMFSSFYRFVTKLGKL